MDKAHVQHPVGLVQHEDFHPAQVQQALALEVQQAAGGGNQDIQALFDLVHLGLLSHAAEDNGGAQGQVLAVGFEALLDLEGQLPGGGEDEGADIPGPHHHVGVEPLEDRGGEGAGLARAGLGAAQHVPALEGGGDGLALDGGGLGVALGRQCLEDRGDQPQLIEFHGILPLRS